MNLKKDVIFTENKNGLLELDITSISDWVGFDKLKEFLEQNYLATVVEEFDG